MQDTTPLIHAQEKLMIPEKPLALKEHCIPNEHLSSIDVLSFDKDTVTVSQENKGEELVIKQPVATGIPQEFEDEVCN